MPLATILAAIEKAGHKGMTEKEAQAMSFPDAIKALVMWSGFAAILAEYRTIHSEYLICANNRDLIRSALLNEYAKDSILKLCADSLQALK